MGIAVKRRRSKKLLNLSAVYFGHVDPEAEGFKIICEVCLGDGCKQCGDRGILKHTGRLADSITKAGYSLFEQFKFLKSYNIWPVDGGLIRQSCKFIACIKWCDLVNLKLEEQAKKDKDAKAGFADKFQKMLGSKKG